MKSDKILIETVNTNYGFNVCLNCRSKTLEICYNAVGIDRIKVFHADRNNKRD